MIIEVQKPGCEDIFYKPITISHIAEILIGNVILMVEKHMTWHFINFLLGKL